MSSQLVPPITYCNAVMREVYRPPTWPVRAGAGQLRTPAEAIQPPAPEPAPQVDQEIQMLASAPSSTQQQRRKPRPAARTSRAERDRAVERVTLKERKEWRELHDRELMLFLVRRGSVPFLAEDFRAFFARRGHPNPHHPNVWGAMWFAAARDGVVVKTGKYLPMQDRRSHARVTAEWRKT
jgi:hypothetical protein